MFLDKTKIRRNKNINNNIDTIFAISEKKDYSNKFTNVDQIIDKNLFNQEMLKSNKKNNSIYRFAISFLLIFLFSILPIRIIEGQKNMTAYANESAEKLDNVYQSIKSNDYTKAKKELINIEKNIKEIDTELKDIGQKNIIFSRFGILNEKTINYERLFDASIIISEIGSKIVEDYGFLENISFSKLENEDNTDLFERIKKLNSSLKDSEKKLDELKIIIKNIDQNQLGQKESEYVRILKENSENIDKYFQMLLKSTDQFSNIFGENSDKKYLVLFQNNTEIRATGGFIGTYGIITLNNAKIKNIFIDSIYNPDGQTTKKIDPPEPFKKIIDQFFMRDANWYPDFPTSAKQISDLYEIEGGFTPDGIIAIDTKPFLDILELTGPVYLDKYDIEINKDNFLATTQFKTSIDYNPEDKNPKKFLADFAPLFLEKIKMLEGESQKNLIKILANNIEEKHIQFYSPNKNIQEIYSSLGFSGEIKNVEKSTDYFNYINTNIGGLKTNLLIKEKIGHIIYKEPNGKILHEVNLERNHTGENSGFSGTNYAYLRFYIPLGSKIISISGFEKKESIKMKQSDRMLYIDFENYQGKAELSDIDRYEENGKLVLGAWQVLEAGKSLESKIVYELPENINLKKDYKLIIQKQAGVIEQDYLVSIKNNEKMYIPENSICFDKNQKNQCQFKLTRDEDIYFYLK